MRSRSLVISMKRLAVTATLALASAVLLCTAGLLRVAVGRRGGASAPRGRDRRGPDRARPMILSSCPRRRAARRDGGVGNQLVPAEPSKWATPSGREARAAAQLVQSQRSAFLFNQRAMDHLP